VTPTNDIPGFRTSLIVEKVAARRWRLASDLRYVSCVLDDEAPAPPLTLEIVVCAGTTTDFASVPRGLWNLFPPDDSYTAAAVVHDFLYQGSYMDSLIWLDQADGVLHISADVSTVTLNRAQADAVFLEAMKASGTPWLKRHIIWLAVRLFGWLHYGRRR
jgi:hypothetical protein